MNLSDTASDKSDKRNFWIYFICIALGEFFLFKHFVYNEIVTSYPFGFDQASYLPLLYLTFENIKKLGLIAGISQSPSLPTGFLFPIQSSLVYLISGASRWSGLLINMMYFIGLQFCCVKLIKDITNKNYFFIFFLGILLTIKTPFLKAGGNLFDIRIDFIAFCLYGIFICAVIKSNFFYNRKWTLLAASVACLVILIRTITSVYVGGAGICLFIYLLVKKCLSNAKGQRETNQRIINLIIFGVAIALITLPFIWLNREALYNYYMIGHVLGQERFIRATQAGITNTASILVYYPRQLVHFHIGWLAFSFCFALVSFYFLLQTYFKTSIFYTREKNTNYATVNGQWDAGFAFLFFAILIPLIALTLDMNKSPVVASIMVIPAIWLMLWYCLFVDSKIKLTPLSDTILKYAAFLIFFVGIINQFHIYHTHLSKTRKHDLATITKMYLDIGDYAISKNWPAITMGVDQIVDYITCGGLETVYYESTGKLVNVGVEKLGGSIFAITREEAMASIKRTNVFIVNLGEYKNDEPYPYHKSIVQLKPMLKQYAEQHFTRLGDYQFLNSTYRVYVTN